MEICVTFYTASEIAISQSQASSHNYRKYYQSKKLSPIRRNVAYHACLYHSFPVGIHDKTTFWLDCPHLGLSGSSWLRSQGCDPTNTIAKHLQVGNWTFEGKTVQRCLVEERDEVCTLQFASTIPYTVIICNAVKATALLAVFLLSTPALSSTSLVTVGDAVENFLIDPDPYTVGMNLLCW